MLPIAGQTARLNGLNFFVEIPNFFQHFSYLLFYLFFKIKKKIYLFLPRATPGPSAS